MDNDPGTIREMREEERREKIRKLQKKIDIIKYNMEASSEILSEAPSDIQKEKLMGKNRRRQHGITGLGREVRDIEEVLEKQEQKKRGHVGASAFLWLSVVARLVSVGGLLFVITSLFVIGVLDHCLATFRFLFTDSFRVNLIVFRHDITSSMEFTVDSALSRVENKY